ncbi:Zinc finger transcription factor ace1 [Paramyrothecium foliicola]|nr:Zinc finger transcription factor ace1 [Paramyrothecium foliicola]
MCSYEFKPCPCESKCASNCKQHLEKVHGWMYMRTEINGEKASSSVTSPAQQTAALEVMSRPSETSAHISDMA